MQLGYNRASQEYTYKITLSVWRPFGVDGWIFQRQTDEMRTCGTHQILLRNDETCLLKLLLTRGLGRLFPLHFRMRFWSWKSGRAWLMASFYQKQQEFISGITPIRGKKWHNSVQAPRGLQGSPDLLLAQESGWQPESFHVFPRNEAATSSSMQDQLTVSSDSLMPENQLLQNVHLPCCRYTHLVNFIPSLRTIDYSPFCYRRYLGMSVKQMWSQPLVSWICNSTKRFTNLNQAYQHNPELFRNFKQVVEGAANTSGPQTVLRWLSQRSLRVLWKREGNTMPRCRSTFCSTHAPAGWGHPQETHTNTPEPTHQQPHLRSFTRSHMAARIQEIRTAN